MTKASSSVHPAAGVAEDPLLAANEASASDIGPTAEAVTTEKPESELIPAVTDIQSSEIRPVAFLSNRITAATYRDALMYRNKVMVSNYILKNVLLWTIIIDRFTLEVKKRSSLQIYF